MIIDEAEGLPSSSTYSSRFGSLARAYQLVGFTPERDFKYIEINRLLRALQPEVVAETIEEISQIGGHVAQDRRTHLLKVNDEFTVALCIARCHETAAGTLRWNSEVRAELARRHESFPTRHAVNLYPGDPMRVPTSKLTMRVLRDTCITALHDAGCIRDQIRAITGHAMSSIDEILARYAALTIDQAGMALARLTEHQERQRTQGASYSDVRHFEGRR